jgi:hypothetical protein
MADLSSLEETHQGMTKVAAQYFVADSYFTF